MNSNGHLTDELARAKKAGETWNKLKGEFHDIMRRNTRTCLNCLYFVEKTEQCTRYNSQRPPARIIANGCDGHDDEIPF